MSLEDKLRDLVQISEEMGLYDMPIQVCLTHHRIWVCRSRKGNCVWSEDPDDVTRIQAELLRAAAKRPKDA